MNLEVNKVSDWKALIIANGIFHSNFKSRISINTTYNRAYHRECTCIIHIFR